MKQPPSAYTALAENAERVINKLPEGETLEDALFDLHPLHRRAYVLRRLEVNLREGGFRSFYSEGGLVMLPFLRDALKRLPSDVNAEKEMMLALLTRFEYSYKIYVRNLSEPRPSWMSEAEQEEGATKGFFTVLGETDKLAFPLRHVLFLEARRYFSSKAELFVVEKGEAA